MNAAPPIPEKGALSLTEIRAVWPLLAHADRLDAFALLPRDEAQGFFAGLDARDQEELIRGLPPVDQRAWMCALPPDDAADVVQAAPLQNRAGLLALLDERTCREVTALLAYDEDKAGGLMNPRYLRVRPDVTVDDAMSYLHKHMQERGRTIYYAYVLDAEHRLIGVVSFRQLFTAPSGTRVREVMRTDVITIPEQMNQEEVTHKFAHDHLTALPVVDRENRMKGVVTVDDVVDVVQEEATEDMQKMGGVSALDGPYLQIATPQRVSYRRIA